MLEFNDGQSGPRRSPGVANNGVSFVVRYVAPGCARSPNRVACEKHYLTKSAALNFCVVLRNLGGSPNELLQLIHGETDAVLDGPGLEEAIDLQRNRLETQAIPPWR